jgi:hypothetical protein
VALNPTPVAAGGTSIVWWVAAKLRAYRQRLDTCLVEGENIIR